MPRRDVVSACLIALLLWLFLRAQGGFYQRSWSTAEVVFLFAAGALVLLRGLPLSRAEGVFVGGLAAFVGWTALSALWSESVPRTIEEVQRGIVYPAAMLALLLARPARAAVAAGVLAAAVAACGWALLQRLGPDLFGHGRVPYDHRLAEPLDYANGTGLLAAIGLLLALGLALASARGWARAAAGAAVVPLAAALTFTFSRGSWLALALGLAVAVLAGPRLRTTAGAAALALPAALGVWLCASSRPLAVGFPSPALRHDGHRALAALAALAVLDAAVAVALPRLRVELAPRTRRRLGIAAAAAPVAAALAATIPYGGPIRVAERTGSSFSAQPPAAVRGTRRAVADPRTRLLDAHGSGRAQLWRVAWRDVQAHPLLGSGAGTYAIRWARERPSALLVQDAHSLYLETLAELGPVGLALLLAALAAPLAVFRRRGPLAAALAGAYVAYLAEAAIDWDWELAALTCAGLACGAALLLRPHEERAPAPARVRAALAAPVFALLAAACVGVVGSVALARAESAAGRRDWAAALPQARRATHWLPWQSEAWRVLGEAQLAGGDRAAAAAAFRAGVRRDPSDWRLWSRLAAATTGAERRRALDRTNALNPRASFLVTALSQGRSGAGSSAPA